MGYESKIYVVQEWEPLADGKLGYGDVIAVFDLCKMGYDIYNGKSFRQLFNQARTCDFYADDGNTIIKEDCYGDEIEKADNAEVIAWMKEMTRGTDWYRAKLFYKFLLEIEKSGAAYSLYHYGY